MWILVLKIVAELVLALICIYGSYRFWGVLKARRLRISICQNEHQLDEIIRVANDVTPFSVRASKLEQLNGDWLFNMDIHSLIAIRANRSVRNMMLALIVISSAISYFLGWPYLLANGVIFVLCAAVPVFAVTRSKVIDEIIETATIAYCWKHDDPDGWIEFLPVAWSLKLMNKSLDRHAT